MSKAAITRTVNPLHFEDLEPHRFEDLVRQLTYDFRDWHKIEATGRAGSDEGIDIRAWEKARTIINEDDEDKSTGEQLIEGNLWVIQCKREKHLGPTKVRKIVSDFKGDNTVYGYIIAAPVNFSKKSYDVFREEIRKKGITECYLWGKAELEDMLLMPKNDHILFTFFGISLSVRRKSRTSEVKFKVNNKNKLHRILGNGFFRRELHQSVLLRDIYDENYPWKEKYEDFEDRPRWQEVIAYGYHPQGLLVHLRKYYAYFDRKAGEFDFTDKKDLLPRLPKLQESADQDSYEREQAVEDYFRHLPRRNQAALLIDGIVAWEDMLLIDDKGDSSYECPHIFVDTRKSTALITWMLYEIEQGQNRVCIEEQFKRKKVFPKTFPSVKKLKISRTKSISLDSETKRLFQEKFATETTLFGIGKKYENFNKRDVVPIVDVTIDNEPLYLEITHRYVTTVEDYLEESGDTMSRTIIERQFGKEVKDKQSIRVLECRRIYKWQIR